MTTATNLDLFTQPKPSSPAAKWVRWIATPEGRELFAEIERIALARWHNLDTRIEVNAIVSMVRRGPPPVSIDNSLRSFISRALIAKWPVLTPLIEVRRQRSEAEPVRTHG